MALIKDHLNQMAEKLMSSNEENPPPATASSRNRPKKIPLAKVDSGLGKETEVSGSRYPYQVGD